MTTRWRFYSASTAARSAKIGEPEVDSLAEGVSFSADGRFVYIAGWDEQELVTYRIEGDKLTPVGSPLKLPGHPASLRGTLP